MLSIYCHKSPSRCLPEKGAMGAASTSERTSGVSLGLSQEQSGELFLTSSQRMQKYESGVNRIGVSRLFVLSQVLDVPISFFDGIPGSITANFGGKPETKGGFSSRRGPTHGAPGEAGAIQRVQVPSR